MKKYTIALFIGLLPAAVFGQLAGLQSQSSFGGSQYDYSKEVEYTSDGGFITIGYTESSDGNVSFNHGSGDCWIVKTNAAGSVQWEKTLGGSGFDYGYSIRQTADGGYIAAGYTESSDGDVTSNHGGGDCWIMKLNAAGALQWQKTFGGSLRDNAQSVRRTADGGYIVCGNSESSDGDVSSNHGGGDGWILKLSSTGALEWETALGGTSYDFAQDVIQTSDGGYVMTGGTHSADGDVSAADPSGDCWILKLNSTGNVTWENTFGGSGYDFSQSVIQSPDGGYVLAGYSESNDGDVTADHGGGDCWIIKCDNAGSLQWERSFGSSGNDYAYSVIQQNGGGYIFTGYAEMNDGDVSGNHGSYDCWVVMIDAGGSMQAQGSFGGAGVDIGHSIRQVSGGSYVIAGYTESADGDVSASQGGGDCWLITLNTSTVGVQEQAAATVSVSPNPGAGQFLFSGLVEGSTVSIYDMSGRLISANLVGSDVFQADLSDAARGIYIYRVTAESGKTISGKLILN